MRKSIVKKKGLESCVVKLFSRQLSYFDNNSPLNKFNNADTCHFLQITRLDLDIEKEGGEISNCAESVGKLTSSAPTSSSRWTELSLFLNKDQTTLPPTAEKHNKGKDR